MVVDLTVADIGSLGCCSQGSQTTRKAPSWRQRKRIILGRVPQEGQAMDLVVNYDLRDSIFGILGRPVNSHVSEGMI